MVKESSVRAATAPYTEVFLKVYDLWVVRISNSYAWRCDRKYFAALYADNVGARHLEVGPGSGWAIAHVHRPPAGEVTLLDLNPNCIEHTRRRIGDAEALHQSVFEAIPESAGRFDSIAVNYVLHCIPGDWEAKAAALGNLAAALTDDGVLFGSTVVTDTQKNLFGTALMLAYNQIGAFHNRSDDTASLELALRQHFQTVNVWMVGDVAFFTALRPKSPSPDS